MVAPLPVMYGDPRGELARIAVLGDHPIPLAIPLGEDGLDHRTRAARKRVAATLPFGDHLGGPRVATEQHDQPRDSERSDPDSHSPVPLVPR